MTDEVKGDGRKGRRDKSREAIVCAALSLIHHGNWRPSVKEIAAAAAVSVRTVFSIFGTLDDVYEELIRFHGTSLQETFDQNAQEMGAHGALRIVLIGSLWKTPKKQEPV